MLKRSLIAVALFSAVTSTNVPATTVESLQAQREAVIQRGLPHLDAIDFENPFVWAALASYMDHNLHWRIDSGELNKMLDSVDPNFRQQRREMLADKTYLSTLKATHRHLVRIYWNNPELGSSAGTVLAAKYPEIFYRGFWK